MARAETTIVSLDVNKIKIRFHEVDTNFCDARGCILGARAGIPGLAR